MQIIGSSDDDGIGKFGTLENIFPGIELITLRYIMFLTVSLFADSNGFGHANNIELIGILYRIISIYISTGARATGNSSHRFFHRAMQGIIRQDDAFSFFIGGPGRKGQGSGRNAKCFEQVAAG